ncbi:nucleotidyltransferase domain-containing protein [Brevundimonas sp. AJA228-03]|uniref:type VII toxin-antitoxin system MntA family adenylyltransferase antitoxin n=1 Tax=Brevundimonas sp. AJA228-03 TaxID=2752515 RepID=UPI001ADF4CD3|nr:nucleotidyltransferase domain-containing protein [Brevundimonas sp. AJA228-03]QTN19079.1 nucleotidyltransferase domain-containing protein [Brevundimonas sp. AJA228-03]
MSPDTAVPILERLIPGLAAVYVFGSAARGDARADSDLDLAIVVDGPLAPGLREEARLAVEDGLGIDVDLVDLATASPILGREVLREGRRIAAFRPFIADLAEIRMMRDYEDLKERRRGIEADIARRGRVLAA